MFTLSTLRPLAFIFTALHPNNVYVSADMLMKACEKGNLTLVCNAMMQSTCAFEIITKCTDEEMLLGYVHDVERMTEIRVDAMMQSLGLNHTHDFLDQIIGRVYIMNMIITMQEMHDMTPHCKTVMLNVLKSLARGLQSLIADAEGHTL